MASEKRRKSLRAPGFDYSSPGAYFVTMVTFRRAILFGEIAGEEMILNKLGNIVKDTWLNIPVRYKRVTLDEFVVMPNHIHGILVFDDSPVGAIHELPLQEENPEEYRIRRRRMLLPKAIGYFKMNSAKRINQLLGSPTNPVWQRNYYEHVIRTSMDWEDIRYYIQTNPLTWADDEDNPAATE